MHSAVLPTSVRAIPLEKEHPEMNVSTNADVNCVDGSGGRITHLILDPEKKEITHLVVKDGLLGDERLVPLTMVVDSTSAETWLRCTKSELKQLPPFARNEQIQPSQPSDPSAHGDVILVPGMAIQRPLTPITVKREQIPDGEIAMQHDISVNALDGRIGHVSEFLLFPPDHKISYLVAEEGHLWDKKHITIPVSEIGHIDKDGIHLRITKDIVEALPTV